MWRGYIKPYTPSSPHKYLNLFTCIYFQKIQNLRYNNVYTYLLVHSCSYMLLIRYNLNLLGIDFKHIPAVDGKTLNQDYIDQHNIQV